MSTVNVSLKGDVKQFERGVSAYDIAKIIGPGLAKAACACTVDGEACDLRTPIAHDCTLSIETFDTPEGKHAFWHTASHVMAE
ncbi:MAG: TGS domain-containing protein, partial [Oscillospiraceae bacterium]